MPSILLVEDTAETSEMIKLFLRTAGAIDLATDAQSALDMAAVKQYDLILMDINLGRGMTGLDVTRILREKDEYRTIPIIALTAYAMKGDREMTLEAGCSEYLSKPFSKRDLLDLIGQFMPA